MSNTQIKLAGIVLLFLIIFVLGYLLSKGGRPYNQLVFTIHKFVTLGTIVLLASMIIKINRADPLSKLQLSMVLLMAVCFLADMVTGGLLSLERASPEFIHKLHQAIPYLTIISTAVSLYLLL